MATGYSIELQKPTSPDTERVCSPRRVFPSPRCHTWVPLPDLTDEDCNDLARLVREAIEAEPYRIGPRINRLRLLLAKLEPELERPAAMPFPPPLPSAVPSPLYRKLRGGRR